MCLGRVGWDHATYARQQDTRSRAKRVVAQAQEIVQGKDSIGQKETGIQDQARKQFEMFEYRDLLPKLHEILISALPNAKNNPDQRALYEAWATGDVAKVTAMPRNKRKQVFVTLMSLYYSDNLGSAQFNKTALMRRDQMAQGTMEGSEMYDQETMSELEAIYGPDYMKQLMGTTGQESTKEVGFVVTVAGYSPYEAYETLLDRWAWRPLRASGASSRGSSTSTSSLAWTPTARHSSYTAEKRSTSCLKRES